MSIFALNEKVEFLARQTLHYDRYAGRQYFLERVEVDGKFGLICVEQSDYHGAHTKILLAPIYDEIYVTKISSERAVYRKFEVFANGTKVALFTLVQNTWVPVLCFKPDSIRHPIRHNE